MTTERVLETPMPILLGLLGAIAFGLGVMIGMRELRLMREGSAPIDTLQVWREPRVATTI